MKTHYYLHPIHKGLRESSQPEVIPPDYHEITEEEYRAEQTRRSQKSVDAWAASERAQREEAVASARTVYNGLKNVSAEAALVMAQQVLGDFDPERDGGHDDNGHHTGQEK